MLYSLFQPLSILEQGKRDNQEDSIFPLHQHASSTDRLFILCDGMGGYEKGEIASSTICESIAEYLQDGRVFSEKLFYDSLVYSYKKLSAKVNGNASRIGTTMTMLYFYDQGCFAAHIGDSRIYHIRPKNHKILYVSRDHSLVNDLIDAGVLNKEDVSDFPQRHVITKAIRMDKEISHSDVEVKHITDIHDDDYFLLLSDGMMENLSEDELLSLICRQDLSDEEKRNWLIANSVNNSDNHSAYIIHLHKVHIQESEKTTIHKSTSYDLSFSKKKVDYWMIAFFILCVLFVIIVICLF